MVPYLVAGICLWLAALASLKSTHGRLYGWASFAIVTILTSLRYEIGYDWLAYERYFQWAGHDISLESYRASQTLLPVEFLYFLLNAVIIQIGGSFEFLLFTISVFNLIVIDRMANEIDETSRPFVWLFYFCLALIMVQFNIIRQSIASSFVILALLLACRGKRWPSLLAFVGALGFHTSTAIFLPLLFIVNRRVSIKTSLTILIVGAIVFFLGAFVLSTLLSTLAAFLPGAISSKTDTYATGIAGGNVWGISVFAGILILFYIGLLIVFLKLKPDPYVNVAIWLTLAVLFAHIAFGQVPIIWNRVMCVSFPWQMAVLWGRFLKSRSFELRIIAVGVGGVTALGVFAFQLTRPENIAFVPYHSLAQVWATGDKGDGRLRSMYAVQQGEIEASQRASQGGL